MGRRRLANAACAAAMLLGAILLIAPAGARAARVLVMSRDGHVHVAENPFLGRASSLGPPRPHGVRAASPSAASGPRAQSARAQDIRAHSARAHPKKPTKPQVTVVSVLAQLLARGQLSQASHAEYLSQWRAALSEERHLSPTRRQILSSVTELLHTLATRDELIPSRLPVLFLTLERNAQWWRTGPLLGYGTRVQFSGSQIDWEYYPGQGLQLQVLGTFGEANGMWEAGEISAMTALLGQMLPLAADRDGNLAWEYYFDWEGGAPPWVSAMAQATGIEAFTHAYEATKDSAYLADAHAALGLLSTPPPAGVAVPTALGTRFLQYSFAPTTDIINAFLQTLIGLDDYATVSHDPVAEALYAKGTAQATAELPSFNTGAWSLYQPGEEDPLSYHQLVTQFLGILCSQTRTPIYCTTAQAFTADLTTPPALGLLTTKAKQRRAFALRFTLSKISHVGVVVTNARGDAVLYTSASFPYGQDSFSVPKLRRGTYSVRLSATDLAGNYRSITGTLTVSK